MENRILVLMACFAIPMLSGCYREPPAGRDAPSAEVKSPSATTEQSPPMPTAQGAVIETMNTGGYTYVQIDTGSEKLWAAAPECSVKVGDQLAVSKEMPMQNYHSTTLDRDFEVVYFVNAFLDAEGKPLGSVKQLPGGHPPMTEADSAKQVDVGNLEKAEGGVTVAEVHTGKTDLADKEVTLRGKVVKYNQQIMGKNWLHIRDGSGDAATGTNDLTITTAATVKVGDTVLVTGKVSLDKDFGFGYKYGVIIEDATVVVE